MGGGEVTRESIIPVVWNRKSELLRTCGRREFREETGSGHKDERWIMSPDCFLQNRKTQ
jgi:hypothetical protein